MPSSYIAYSLLIFIGVSLAFILISLAFLAISSHKSFREIKSTSLWMLIGSFLLITTEIMLSVDNDSLALIPTPSIQAQFGILLCLLINCALLLYSFGKYQNNAKYVSLNESILILGIMQVTICMSIASSFKEVMFILQIAINAVYLLLPALVIYEFSKTSSISPKGKYLLNQAKKRKDKDSQ